MKVRKTRKICHTFERLENNLFAINSQNIRAKKIYLIVPFSAGTFLTPAPLMPALMPLVLKMRLMPIKAGVKRATNFSKSGIKRAACLGTPM